MLIQWILVDVAGDVLPIVMLPMECTFDLALVESSAMRWCINCAESVA
ncbi:hypothetical protein D934_08280 [Xylella fastidiosa subsp. sandyi Ann-1]|uniref:Uncharacterized protein n=1 Tax=Xylella fastidiosa subsp. sandyi Ann-1 TaxID=155920 RepID=A0A060HEJ9_XYLFS|nr:hypothetical protein D934_08280 [Xylella fastidiosa subsp. sandyi Ann-1]